MPNSLGVKTLDPYDPDYVANYNLNDNSDNFATAHGLNYHNGPEWM